MNIIFCLIQNQGCVQNKTSSTWFIAYHAQCADRILPRMFICTEHIFKLTFTIYIICIILTHSWLKYGQTQALDINEPKMSTFNRTVG